MLTSVLSRSLVVGSPDLGVSGSIFPYDNIRYEGADVHDPSVVEIRGHYMMVATSGREFVPIWTSTDITHWKSHGPIMPASPAWLAQANPAHNSIWAPAPLVVGDTLRMYYCASQKFGSNTSFIGMCECPHFNPDKPTEGWVDKGMLVSSHADKQDNFNAIDPDALVGPDGRHWMVYGSYWSGIYEIELDPTTGLVKQGAVAKHVASNTGERGNPLEAPTLIYHDGYYYLFVTYGLAAQGVRSTYRTMVGRSKNPDGPFLGYTGSSMEEGGHTDFLRSSPPMYGPGGGNAFQDDKGDWWSVYHYYDGTRHWHGDVWGKPTMQMRRIEWTDDGWPLPGLPAGISLEDSRTDSVVGDWTLQADFSDTATASFKSDGSVVLGEQAGHWTLDGHTLKIHWPRTDAPGEEWVDTLVVDKTRQFCVGRNQSGAVIRLFKHDAKVRQL